MARSLAGFSILIWLLSCSDYVTFIIFYQAILIDLRRGETLVYLHGTSKINEQGHLEIGGCDTTDLVAQFGTPLYVMDEELIRNQCREYMDAFRQAGVRFQVAYASKAFCVKAMCRLVDEEGLSLDVVSDGEL